jgi:hypothetical protein
MSVPEHKARGQTAQPFGESVEEAGTSGGAADEAPPPASRRLHAMLAAAGQDAGETAGDALPEAASAPEAAETAEAAAQPDAPHDRVAPDGVAPDGKSAAPPRASRELRNAISAPPDDGAPDDGAPEEADSEPDRPPNRAAALAIRLGAMMGVVFAGVFVARLFDFALGLETRFEGLGVLAIYLVVLTVILAPSLQPRTRRQWIVVIGGFAAVIVAIAAGSAFARLMLQGKEFQHAGLYVEMVIEFGVMFAFWGLASLIFAEVLHRAGLQIGTEPGPSGAKPRDS